MVEINRDGFQGINDPMERDLILFDNCCESQKTLKEIKDAVETLARSPWRMAVPPVSWKAIGVFFLLLTAVIKGDVATVGKLISTILGG
jgi:hypothetical protein